MVKALFSIAFLAVPALCSAPVKERAAPHTLPLPSPQLSTYRLLAVETARYGIPVKLPHMYRVIYRESRFDPNTVNPRSHAAGLCQYMPATFESHRKGAGLPPTASRYSPEDAVRAMAWAWSAGGEKHWKATLDHGGRRW